MREIYDFLKALSENNNKTWFEQNKNHYEKTKSKFLHITEVLIHEVTSFDREIPFLDPKKCMFRIYRDVRFSKDKNPFKTNYGSYIARDGRSGGNVGYYFQIAPGNSFLGAGIFMPDPDKLRAIRTEIFEHPLDFLEIIEDPDFKNNFKLYDEDKLKTAPKGFPKDFEHIDLLKYKSYSPYIEISEEQLFSPDIIETIVNHFRLLVPFNQFLYSAIGEHK
jgi:uncharacterized protein (TIGR02453 family)